MYMKSVSLALAICRSSVLIVLAKVRSAFDVHVTVHHDKFLIIKPTRYTNFSNLFWNETLHVSDSSSVHHQEFSTVHTAMVYVTQPLCIERHTANLYDLYHCRVYSGKLLMMDRGTVRNM